MNYLKYTIDVDDHNVELSIEIPEIFTEKELDAKHHELNEVMKLNTPFDIIDCFRKNTKKRTKNKKGIKIKYSAKINEKYYEEEYTDTIEPVTKKKRKKVGFQTVWMDNLLIGNWKIDRLKENMKLFSYSDEKSAKI
jgi:hypothetical protein